MLRCCKLARIPTIDDCRERMTACLWIISSRWRLSSSTIGGGRRQDFEIHQGVALINGRSHLVKAFSKKAMLRGFGSTRQCNACPLRTSLNVGQRYFNPFRSFVGFHGHQFSPWLHAVYDNVPVRLGFAYDACFNNTQSCCRVDNLELAMFRLVI